MKLTKQYITERLQDTTVSDLAREIAEEAKQHYPVGTQFDMDATITKFEKMLTPFAPTTVKATDAMRALGVAVVEA